MMSIRAVRKHLVIKRYYDYGNPLDVTYGTASSVDDSGPVSDGNGFNTRQQAIDYIEAWLTDEATGEAQAKFGWLVERGPDVERRIDMNPHGLI